MTSAPGSGSPAAIMADLGPLIPGIAAIVQNDDGTEWAIEFDDETLVQVELSEAGRYLTFCCDIGQPAAEHRGSVLEALLMQSLVGAAPGAAFAASAGEGEEIMLLATLPAEGLQLQPLAETVQQLARQARLWHEAIAHWSVTTAPAPLESTGSMPLLA